MTVSPTDDEDPDEMLGAEEESGSSEGESGQEGSKSAESPTAENQDANKPQNIADAVRAALNPEKEQSSDSGEDEGGSGESADPKAVKAAGEEEELGELTDEELASYKPKTQRRIKQFREQVKTLSTELADAKPLADRYLQVETFCTKANLTPEDVNTGMNIMRLMKNEPVKAYEAITPIYEKLRALVGVVLSPELQQQVSEGKITQEAAQELSRLKAATGLSAAQQMQADQRAKDEREQAARQTADKFSVDVGLATTEWEQRWKASDPDYSLKHARVSEAIELELRKRIEAKTLPTTIKDAVRMCDDVKARVEKEMQKLLPKKRAISPSPQVPGSTNGSRPVAKSVYDAVAQAVGYK